jgi:hypothetical protein
MRYILPVSYCMSEPVYEARWCCRHGFVGYSGRRLEMKNGRSAQLLQRFTVRFSSFNFQVTPSTIEYGYGRPPFTQPRY